MAENYSYMLGGETCGSSTCSALISFMATGDQTEIKQAFDAWASVANLNFFEVLDDGAAFNSTTTSGDIRLGGKELDGPSGVLARSYFPPENVFAAGYLHFDSSDTWSVDGAGGSLSISWVTLHEIGHALGLDHQDQSNTMMSTYYNTSLSGLQIDDITGIQHVYGAPSTVPVPAALCLFGSGLIALLGFRKKAVYLCN